MKNKIIIVGDSYTFGHGCSDRIHYYDKQSETWIGDQAINVKGPSQHCWASLAARDFSKYEFINLSAPGNSNDNIFKGIADTVDLNTELVMFAGSFSNRMLIKDHGSESVFPWIVGMNWLPSEPTQPKSYFTAKESFIKHLYIDSMGNNYTVMAIMSAWAASILYQSKFVWSIPGHEPTLVDKQLTTVHMQSLQFLSIARYPFNDKFNIQDESVYLAADGHINDYGHNLYYETEIKPLLTRLLS